MYALTDSYCLLVYDWMSFITKQWFAYFAPNLNCLQYLCLSLQFSEVNVHICLATKFKLSYGWSTFLATKIYFFRRPKLFVLILNTHPKNMHIKWIRSFSSKVHVVPPAGMDKTVLCIFTRGITQALMCCAAQLATNNTIELSFQNVKFCVHSGYFNFNKMTQFVHSFSYLE